MKNRMLRIMGVLAMVAIMLAVFVVPVSAATMIPIDTPVQGATWVHGDLLRAPGPNVIIHKYVGNAPQWFTYTNNNQFDLTFNFYCGDLTNLVTIGGVINIPAPLPVASDPNTSSIVIVNSPAWVLHPGESIWLPTTINMTKTTLGTSYFFQDGTQTSAAIGSAAQSDMTGYPVVLHVYTPDVCLYTNSSRFLRQLTRFW